MNSRVGVRIECERGRDKLRWVQPAKPMERVSPVGPHPDDTEIADTV